MKKLLTTIVFLSSLYVAKAQEGWLFSPDLGINLVPLDDGDVKDTYFKTGVSFGFSAHNIVEDKWVFNYGISFNRRFASYSYTNESDALSSFLPPGIDTLLAGLADLTIYESTRGLSTFWTFDIPISVSYKFNNDFLFWGGGYVNFLLSTSNDEEFTSHIPVFETFNPTDLGLDPALLPQNETYTTTNDSKTNFNTLGYGFQVGFGYQSDNWLVRLGYHHGLNDIATDDFKFNMVIKNQRSVMLTVSYLIEDLFMTSKNDARYDLELIE